MSHNRLLKVFILVSLSGVLGVLYLKYKMVFFLGGYLLKILLGVSLILLLFTATSCRRFGDKVSLWLGNVSYEVYLSHGIVMWGLSRCLPNGVDSGLFILLTVIVTLGLSTLVHFVGAKIVQSLRH